MTIALKIALVTAAIGIVLGFFGQRSRMCFIGGWRDFFLIRDTYLLKGFFAFLITSAILFFYFDATGHYMKNYPWFEQQSAVQYEVEGDIHNFPDQCDLVYYNAVASADSNIKGIVIGETVLPFETLVMYLAAFLLGLLSTLSNGCPLRQHVMAGSGNASAMLYLGGFYVGVVIYNLYVHEWLNLLIN
ncbi:MAG: hypothetical protein IJP33_02010 [Firmicutes bacterium]|nr:hypothetical protein [Bacillota bacterium]